MRGRTVIAMSSGCHVGWLYEHATALRTCRGQLDGN
jgi:hypothetical protein